MAKKKAKKTAAKKPAAKKPAGKRRRTTTTTSSKVVRDEVLMNGRFTLEHTDATSRQAGSYTYGPAEIWVSGPAVGTWYATIRFKNQEKDVSAKSLDAALEKATAWVDAAPELVLPNPISASEKRWHGRMRKELGVSAKEAGDAILGLRVMKERDWDYGGQDDYDEDTGERINLVILVDANGTELARGWEHTFSDIGQMYEAGSMAYYEDLRQRDLEHGGFSHLSESGEAGTTVRSAIRSPHVKGLAVGVQPRGYTVIFARDDYDNRGTVRGPFLIVDASDEAFYMLGYDDQRTGAEGRKQKRLVKEARDFMRWVAPPVEEENPRQSNGLSRDTRAAIGAAVGGAVGGGYYGGLGGALGAATGSLVGSNMAEVVGAVKGIGEGATKARRRELVSQTKEDVKELADEARSALRDRATNAGAARRVKLPRRTR